MPDDAVTIRWLLRRDLDQVLDIERRSFDEPWTPKVFTTTMRERCVSGMVAELYGDVVGYVVVWVSPSGEKELINLAVDYDYRKRGIGRKLVECVWSRESKVRGDERLVTKIRESNLDAQLFFRACGFQAVDVDREYFDNDEDAYVMAFDGRVPCGV